MKRTDRRLFIYGLAGALAFAVVVGAILYLYASRQRRDQRRSAHLEELESAQKERAPMLQPTPAKPANPPNQSSFYHTQTPPAPPKKQQVDFAALRRNTQNSIRMGLNTPRALPQSFHKKIK